jgi:uncharacterized membrane protein YbjE (DUF340 family)
MSTALSGLFILLFVLPGFVLALAADRLSRHSVRVTRARNFLHGFQEWILLASLWILLALMGFRLMADPQVTANLPTLGAQALAYAAIAVLFSILAALPIGIRSQESKAGHGDAPPTLPTHPLRKLLRLLLTPLQLLAIVIAGALAALLVPAIRGLPIGPLTDICLKIMLVAVGLGLGFTNLQNLTAGFRKRSLLLPLASAAATLAAGALASLFLIPHLGKSMAVVAGFGWYSLSGILIADMGNAQLGALAFLANLFRESLALLSIPLLQHFRRTGSAIAAAGATSMDVSLPVLSLYGAGSFLPLAVFHGFILSLLVPILVPVLMGV